MFISFFLFFFFYVNDNNGDDNDGVSDYSDNAVDMKTPIVVQRYTICILTIANLYQLLHM